MFAFTPIDDSGVIGETVYVTPDATSEQWAKLYYEADTKMARIYSSENTSAEVVFAAYKGGNLIDVEIVPVKLTANTKATAAGIALVTDGADTVKVMLWNSADGAIPLCENIVTR